jgi:N-methylhydantoinase A
MSVAPGIRFAIDTGGTFTDVVVLDEIAGKFALHKAATTPQDTLGGLLAAIEKPRIDLRTARRFFVHGSTTALNALLERCTTYNPKYRKPAPLVPRELCFEVTERVDAKMGRQSAA